MSQRKWTKNALYYFLLLYKKHECLWNVKKASYTNKALRDAAFSDIAAKMLVHNLYGLGPEEMKSKIVLLQRKYYQLRKKNKNSLVSPSAHAGKWYEVMEHIVKFTGANKLDVKSNLDYKLYDISKSQENEASSSTIKPAEIQENDNSLLQKEINHIISVKLPMVSSVKLQSRIEIMNVLKKLYIQKVEPNYSIMFDILTNIIKNDDECLISSIEGFKLEMTKLGYLCKETIDGKNMIIENAEQRFERYLYLTKIKQIRLKLNQQIIYIDERILSPELKYEKVNDLKGDLPPETSVFFHAISKGGFNKGLFVNQASEEDFNKWVVDILLGYLTTPCVIIMDNGPLHGKLEEISSVTRYSTKNEILKWLDDNNIPCSSNMSKPELFELIKKNRREDKEYKIDRILRSHGHGVLRLPHSFPGLNMTDILWESVADENKMITETASNTSLQMLQSKLIDNILPSITKKKWSYLEKVLIMKENEIFDIDVAIENILDTYIFK